MFFLAGLLGMMVLGSVAVVSTADLGSDADSVDGTGNDSDDPMAPEEGARDSLFAEMGLLTQPGLIEEGGAGDDLLTGTGQTDMLGGAGGDDTLAGGGADDELVGGDGADMVQGDAGADTLHGEAGDDTLSGGNGDDALFGHDGDDALLGGDGDDSLQGGLGDDALFGEDGDDALLGREGADTLDGGPGEDTLFGGWGDDLLNGVTRGSDGADTDGTDFLNGADGDDTLGVGSGDVASGGAGADSFVLGGWITGAAAELVDFDAAEDQIMIVFDDSTDAEPNVEMRVSEEDPALTEIVLDGTVVSVLPTASAPSLDALVLIGESTAEALALG